MMRLSGQCSFYTLLTVNRCILLPSQRSEKWQCLFQTIREILFYLTNFLLNY